MRREHGNYRVLGKVGEGAFGTVFRARDRVTGADVALKQIRVRDLREFPANAVREINALNRLRHPYVMPLLGVHTHGSNVVLVMPFVPHSLAALLDERVTPLPERYAGALAQMLLAGLCALHSEGMLHRDIKPGNILLTPSGVLRIADFGQARLMPAEPDDSLSHAVATRWYRAPELLLGSRRYGTAVDMWAAGCVIAQLLTLSPLLPGDSDIDQLFRVVQFLGTPTSISWPGFDALPDASKIELPSGLPPVPLARMMPLASEASVHLLSGMLRYDEHSRLSARLALQHPWVVASSTLPAPAADLLFAPRSAVAGAGGSAELNDGAKRSGGNGAPKASRAVTFPHTLCMHAAAPPEGHDVVWAGVERVRHAHLGEHG